MSAVTEAAELSAAIAEHELADDETERLRELVAEDVPIAEALEQVLGAREEAAAPAAKAELEPEELGEPSDKQLRELDRENTRHAAKVQTIMGSHVGGWPTCSKCDGIGLEEPGPEPRTNESYRECPVCAGFSVVLTGSRNPQFASAPCPGCGGRGFQERRQPADQPLSQDGVAAPLLPASPAAPLAPSQPAAPATAAGVDEWGTPAWMGDPNIGA